MKALTKLLADFITWRWTPTVGLLSAALVYVLVVVGMIPTEIGVPVANAKFAPRTLSTGALGAPATTIGADTTTDSESPPPLPRTAAGDAVARAPSEFGRRGFSPPLERPDPPPAPEPPPPPPPPAAVIPPPPPVMVAPPESPPEVASVSPPPTSSPPFGNRLGGMFQGLSSAMRARIANAPPNTQAPGEAPPQQPPSTEGQAPAEGQAPSAPQPPPGAEATPVPPPQ